MIAQIEGVTVLTPEDFEGITLSPAKRKLTKFESERKTSEENLMTIPASPPPEDTTSLKDDKFLAMGVVAKKLQAFSPPLRLVVTEEVRLERLADIEEEFNEQQEECVEELSSILESMRVSAEVGFAIETEMLQRHLECSKKLVETHKRQEQLLATHRDPFLLLRSHLSQVKVSFFFDSVKELLVNYFVVYEGTPFIPPFPRVRSTTNPPCIAAVCFGSVSRNQDDVLEDPAVTASLEHSTFLRISKSCLPGVTSDFFFFSSSSKSSPS